MIRVQNTCSGSHGWQVQCKTLHARETRLLFNDNYYIMNLTQGKKLNEVKDEKKHLYYASLQHFGFAAVSRPQSSALISLSSPSLQHHSCLIRELARFGTLPSSPFGQGVTSLRSSSRPNEGPSAPKVESVGVGHISSSFSKMIRG